MKRGQIAVEYVIVMGFAFLLTVPLLFIFFENSSAATEQVKATQSDQVVRKLVTTADALHSLGAPSFTTLRAYIPEDVTSISFSGREIIFTLTQTAGITEVVGVTAVNVSGSIAAEAGYHNIRIQAVGNEVVFSEV